MEKLAELRAVGIVDSLTLAVEANVGVYNLDRSVLGSARIMFQISRGGVIVGDPSEAELQAQYGDTLLRQRGFSQIAAWRGNPYANNFDLFRGVLEGSFVLVTIMLLVVQIRVWYVNGIWRFLALRSVFWNFIDFFIYVFMLAAFYTWLEVSE